MFYLLNNWATLKIKFGKYYNVGGAIQFKH